MKIIIIEDEVLAAERLQKLLMEIKPSFEIIAILDSVQNSVKWFQNHPAPDLIFLDIHLADGMSFNIFDRIRINCPIIFCTAYDEYAIKAFELNSIDYLLKPIKKEKLANSIQKFEKIKSYFSEDDLSQVQKILRQYDLKQSPYKSRFLVNKGSSLVPVGIEEVAYFYAVDKVVIMKTKSDQQFVINYSLDMLEKMLDPDRFFRANRQFIVSINAILKINTYFNYKLKIDLSPPSEKELIVSKQKTAQFKDWMSK